MEKRGDPLCAASKLPADRIRLPAYLDSGGLQTVIHGLSSHVFGQYDRVAGRYDAGRYAHRTCGRRDSLDDFITNQGMMLHRRVAQSNT